MVLCQGCAKRTAKRLGLVQLTKEYAGKKQVRAAFLPLPAWKLLGWECWLGSAFRREVGLGGVDEFGVPRPASVAARPSHGIERNGFLFGGRVQAASLGLSFVPELSPTSCRLSRVPALVQSSSFFASPPWISFIWFFRASFRLVTFPFQPKWGLSR